MTAAGSLMTASYDSDGLRASKTNSSGTTYYVYDEQDRPVVELNASGNVSAVNTFGDNGLLSRRDVVNSGTTYYAFDPQGSAVDVMQGNTGLPSAYSAFGIPASGGAGSSPFGFGAQWGYYTDAETGLILCTHRYYDPYTGRFLNRDPIDYDGGINLYNYCENEPIARCDDQGYSGSHPGGPYHPPVGVHTACRPGDSCDEIRKKLWILDRMISSHQGWDRTMPAPRGGGRHQTEIADLYRQKANCLRLLYSSGCYIPPFPLPIWSPQPNPNPGVQVPRPAPAPPRLGYPLPRPATPFVQSCHVGTGYKDGPL